ncbi:hypothetical protein GCM10007049_08760 [Echinicola pacifica]|uniref:Formyl transferase N-terminal domain-containing protein n=1 Tax=Echinicola pacifica TaxID=346377 RepID=A0A918PRH9_9BACT|nr:formyl transferase [Echinicola pacifica]GGZ18747.1 hypothetical protein GCM10007049_08760 [Echinicola pacifica]
MKIVFISECKPRERIVINQVQKIYPDTVVIKPTFNHKKRKSRSLTKLAHRLITKWRERDLRQAVHSRYGDLPIDNIIEMPSDQINKEAGLQLIRSHNPDILITCRAPIVRNQVINIPKFAAINIHYGLAPDYRGNHTLFWAMKNKEFDKVGGTIHHLSPGVDNGNILARVYANVDSNDTESTVDLKTSSLLAEALRDYLLSQSKINYPIIGTKQVTSGKNYKNAERTLSTEISFLWERQFNPEGNAKKASKIERHFGETPIVGPCSDEFEYSSH